MGLKYLLSSYYNGTWTLWGFEFPASGDVGFKVWGSGDVGFNVWGSGDVGFKDWDSGDVGFKVWGAGDSEFKIWGCWRYGVKGLGFSSFEALPGCAKSCFNDGRVTVEGFRQECHKASMSWPEPNPD